MTSYAQNIFKMYTLEIKTEQIRSFLYNFNHPDPDPGSIVIAGPCPCPNEMQRERLGKLKTNY